MPTPGPNDIKASFIVEDQASATLKQIDREAATATKNIEKSTKGAVAVFDKWNFALNALKLGLKGLKFAAQKDADVASIFDESTTALVNLVERLVFVMTPGVQTMDEFRGSMRAWSRELAQGNIREELTGVVEATERIASIDAATFHKLLQPFFDSGDAYKQAQDAFAGFEDQIKSAQEKVRFLLVATTDLATGGLGLTRKEAEALWQSMQKTKDATAKAADSTKDLADAHESAADAARAQREAEEALLRTFSGGWNAALADLEDSFLVAGHAADRFAKEAHNTISTNLFDAVTGKAVSFASFMTGIMNSVLRQVTDAAAAGFLGIFKGVGGSLIGGGASSGAGVGGVYGGASSSFVNAVYSPANPYEQAKGGAWNDGVQMFARGGVVNRPTMFGHSRGVGVMGESGPEAILPLKRGSDGSLGVAGGGSINVTVNLNALDSRAAAAHLRTPDAKKAIGDAIVEAMSSRMDVRRAIG